MGFRRWFCRSGQRQIVIAFGGSSKGQRTAQGRKDRSSRCTGGKKERSCRQGDIPRGGPPISYGKCGGIEKRHLCAAMACQPRDSRFSEIGRCCDRRNRRGGHHRCAVADLAGDSRNGASGAQPRSEEHTSELQSLMRISYAVFCLKKKNQ